jgi:hypothetical protein
VRVPDLLARPLPVPARLVWIDFAHPLEDALGVRLLHIRSLGSIAIPLLSLPRRWPGWFLRPLWHGPYGNHLLTESKPSPRAACLVLGNMKNKTS